VLKTVMSVLCENTAGVPLRVIGEHGLSILIERGEDALLFDTGQGVGLVSNASYLGKDLSKAGCIALSHGHYDHTGGLGACLDQTPTARVFGHPDLFTERFALMGEGQEERALYIGIPFSREDLEKKGAAIDLSSAFQEILPGIFSTGEIPRPPGWKSWDQRPVIKDGQGWKPDPFRDDLSLLVETSKGPVLVLGCGHAGLEHILARLGEVTGLDRLHAVIGGTHLGQAGRPEWEYASGLLEQWRVEKVAVSHCTGFFAASFLASRLGERVVHAPAGSVFEF